MKKDKKGLEKFTFMEIYALPQVNTGAELYCHRGWMLTSIFNS